MLSAFEPYLCYGKNIIPLITPLHDISIFVLVDDQNSELLPVSLDEQN